MYSFEYQRPAGVDAAAAQLAEDDEAVVIAGGMTLIPTLKQRLAQPTKVVDLRDCADLVGIKVEGDAVVIGAMTTHAAVAASAEVAAAIPALASLAGGIGDIAVRNRGTIGGSVANNDPAADYPSAVLALGATVITNKRSIAADDFFVDLFETALEEGEIITAISFPKTAKAGYAKFDQPASRYALCGVFVANTASGVRVAVTGAGQAGVFRSEALEAALSASFTADAVAGVAVSADGLNDDLHGDAAYRANIIKVMAKRAVAAATA
ncbi:MAG: FAD binding domain-containing protein [Rhodospirillaceae bacterium]